MKTTVKYTPNSYFRQSYTLENEFTFIDGLRDPRVLRGYIAGMEKRVRGFGNQGGLSAEEHSKCILRAKALLRGVTQ